MADDLLQQDIQAIIQAGGSDKDVTNYLSSKGIKFGIQPSSGRQVGSIPESEFQPKNVALETAKGTLGTLWKSSGNLVNNAIIQPVTHPLETIGGAASAVMHPINTAKGIASGIGERYGSVDKIANTVATDPMGFVGDVAGTLYGGKGAVDIARNPALAFRNAKQGINVAGRTSSNLAKSLKPTLYNDAFVSDTVKSAISKVQNAVKPLQEAYKKINEPYANQIVDSSTFQQALNSVPKSIRNDFLEEYGTKTLDANGRPQTTIGNLQRMELELKDFIQQPQFGTKINAAEYNVAEAAKKLKDIRLSQLPDDAQAQIRALDKKFGPAIQASNELLPKLADKNGVPNTKFLFGTFKDPARAGMRDYMAGLRSIGVDLLPEIKNIRGWVARQGMKDFGRRNVGRVIEGGVIGGVLRVGH